MIKVIYTAEFVEDTEDLLNKFPPKHKKVYGHHSTIAFRPNDLNGIEIGNKSIMKVIGRVYDEKADAILVENPKSNKKYPHITISCAEGINPLYSDEMIEKAILANSIEYFESPIEISVTEGYFDGVNDVLK